MRMINYINRMMVDEDDAHKTMTSNDKLLLLLFHKIHFFNSYDTKVFKYLMWILNTIVYLKLTLKNLLKYIISLN